MDRNIRPGRHWLLLALLLLAAACAPAAETPRAASAVAPPTHRAPARTVYPSSTPTATIAALVAAPSHTPTLVPTDTAVRPSATSTRVVKPQVYQTATAQARQRATDQAQQQATVSARGRALVQPARPARSAFAAPVSHPSGTPLVLAHYFAWYDGDGWTDCNISAGDRPLEPYHSDDPAAIGRHVQLATGIGLDGFLLHWFAPGGRTDRNFNTLLAQSRGTNFASSVVFSRHIWPGSPAPSRQSIAQALTHIRTSYSSHPNFLRYDQKPVIFFTDVYRTPDAGQTPQQFWTAVRDQVDPGRQTWWIAEGLDASYLSVFDGLYVFKVSHAAYPNDYVKSPRWGAQVRQWSQQTGQEKLWAATISPGWDDVRSGCVPDVRVDNRSHRLGRAEGQTYEATFTAALASQPDWLMVISFNEWVEGTYIEPSMQYGDKYLEMTRDFIRRFKTE